MSGSDAAGADTEQPVAPSGEQPTAPPSRWWVAAITFVAGVVVGVITVGLLGTGRPDFVSATENQPSAAATEAVPTGIGTAGVTGTAEVNVACLRVINEAQDIYTILTGVDQAVRDVDLQQLDDIVRRLQPVEPRLQQDLLDCRVATNVEAGPPASPSAPGQPKTPFVVTTPTATPTR